MNTSPETEKESSGTSSLNNLGSKPVGLGSVSSLLLLLVNSSLRFPPVTAISEVILLS